MIPKPINNESTICIHDHVVIKWDRDVNGEDLPFDFIKMIGKIRKIANNGFVASFKLPVDLFPPDHFASPRRNVGRVFYTVELLPSPSIIEKKLQAVDNIWDCSHSIQRMILGQYRITQIDSIDHVNEDVSMNKCQREAILKALLMSSHVFKDTLVVEKLMLSNLLYTKA